MTRISKTDSYGSEAALGLGRVMSCTVIGGLSLRSAVACCAAMVLIPGCSGQPFTVRNVPRLSTVSLSLRPNLPKREQLSRNGEDATKRLSYVVDSIGHTCTTQSPGTLTASVSHLLFRRVIAGLPLVLEHDPSS